MQRQILMRESAEQMPHLTQTAIGGKRMAIKPRKRSEEHIVMFVTDWYYRCGVATKSKLLELTGLSV